LDKKEIEEHPSYDALLETTFDLGLFTDADVYRITIDERSYIEDENDPPGERIGIQYIAFIFLFL
jgi:hypothetical protein